MNSKEGCSCLTASPQLRRLWHGWHDMVMTCLQLLLLLPHVSWSTQLFHSGTCRPSKSKRESKSQWLQANTTLFKCPSLDQTRMTARGNQINLQILHSLEAGQPQAHESSMLYPSPSDTWGQHLVQKQEVLGSAAGSNLMQNLPVITLSWQRGNPVTHKLWFILSPSTVFRKFVSLAFFGG